MLGKRLINQLSVSDDYEKSFISKLKVTDHLFSDVDEVLSHYRKFVEWNIHQN